MVQLRYAMQRQWWNITNWRSEKDAGRHQDVKNVSCSAKSHLYLTYEVRYGVRYKGMFANIALWEKVTQDLSEILVALFLCQGKASHSNMEVYNPRSP